MMQEVLTIQDEIEHVNFLFLNVHMIQSCRDLLM